MTSLCIRVEADVKFTDEAVVMGIAFSETGKARGSMGIDAADVYNNDGAAIAIGNFSNEKTGFFYAKLEEAYFTDRTDKTGIGNTSYLSLTFGLLFFDCDLDGDSTCFASMGILNQRCCVISSTRLTHNCLHSSEITGMAHFETSPSLLDSHSLALDADVPMAITIMTAIWIYL